MRLAIADPPYLGRAARHYGPGANARETFGSGPKRSSTGRRASSYATTEHPDAAEWDDPATHRRLLDELERDFDAYAVAGWPTSLPVYLEHRPDLRVAVWHKTRAVPGGSRIITSWEPVYLRLPDHRLPRAPGMSVRDVLTHHADGQRHTGAKPPAWTRWVLTLLGYDPDRDTVVDLFPGSGAVSTELTQGILT